MSTFFHVSPARNRTSIAEHGLDWSRMGAARGIAGSRSPEVPGCFVCRGESDADWFVKLNNTGEPVDVWALDGIEEDRLIDNGNGYYYFPDRIPPGNCCLVSRDLGPLPDGTPVDGAAQLARAPGTRQAQAGRRRSRRRRPQRS